MRTDMLPLPDACLIARRPYPTMWRLVLSGAVRAERMSGRWVVARADAEALGRQTPPRKSIAELEAESEAA